MKTTWYYNLIGFILILCSISLIAVIFEFVRVSFFTNKSDMVEEPKRVIEVVPKEVTLVPLTTKPIFIQGLAEPDPEPPIVPKTIIYIQQDIDGVLSAEKGVNLGPTTKETWYNLDMTAVVERMRSRGYTEEEYPYYIRYDGVKCLGDYVIVAADLDIHPRGTVVETSLGKGLVCDTGDFTSLGDWFDIAVDWEVGP